MVRLYGHNPPPVMTENEQALLALIDDEYRPAGYFAAQLEGVSPSSASVALVRLRNRGLIESSNDFGSVRLWRRVQGAAERNSDHQLEQSA